MVSAVFSPGSPIRKNRLHQAHSTHIGRNVFLFLGRVRTATKSLKGRLTVAQPPGATMAVTGKQISTRRVRSKGASAYQTTLSSDIKENLAGSNSSRPAAGQGEIRQI